jgi:hypothetical protein
MCARGDVPRSGGLGAREELMQSRGLTRSGFRWRPTNFGGPLQLIWRTQPTGPTVPINQLQTTLSAVRCAAERCLDDDVLFRIPAMRGLPHHPPSYRPPDVCQSSSAGGAHRHARTPRGARTHSHNGTHKSSPHYMRACVRHTHPIAINCIPFGRRRPWKVLEERPRSRGEPSRAWPRAHHVALVSLFDGTQRRSRPARARHGARLTPQWRVQMRTAAALATGRPYLQIQT